MQFWFLSHTFLIFSPLFHWFSHNANVSRSSNTRPYKFQNSDTHLYKSFDLHQKAGTRSWVCDVLPPRWISLGRIFLDPGSTSGLCATQVQESPPECPSLRQGRSLESCNPCCISYSGMLTADIYGGSLCSRQNIVLFSAKYLLWRVKWIWYVFVMLRLSTAFHL